MIIRTCLITLAFAGAAVSGCAGPSPTRASADADDRSYANFLVVGVAGDYSNRAYFERSVVSGIRAEGASARAFHVVAGGNKPVTRESVKEAITAEGFDAVVVTRVLDTDTDMDVKDPVTGTKVTRKDGNLRNMFRYDYEELDQPLAIEINTKITFASELYDAASEEIVWSAESTGSRTDDIGMLIEETAEAVVKQLQRNDFVGK